MRSASVSARMMLTSTSTAAFMDRFGASCVPATASTPGTASTSATTSGPRRTASTRMSAPTSWVVASSSALAIVVDITTENTATEMPTTSASAAEKPSAGWRTARAAPSRPVAPRRRRMVLSSPSSGTGYRRSTSRHTETESSSGVAASSGSMPTASLDATRPRRASRNRESAASPTTAASMTQRRRLVERSRVSVRTPRTLVGEVVTTSSTGGASASSAGSTTAAVPMRAGSRMPASQIASAAAGSEMMSPSSSIAPRSDHEPAPRADARASAARRRSITDCTPSENTASTTPIGPDAASASRADTDVTRDTVSCTAVGKPVWNVSGELDDRLAPTASVESTSRSNCGTSA